MQKRVRKAVFPVAGLGTRFLPATKAMPKEMLPIVDKPLIDYAVEEAKAAGIEQFFFVTGRAKSAIEDHFDRAFELEATLRERGKTDLLGELEAGLPEPGQIAFTRQQMPLGLGHAVWCARGLVGDEPFAVLLADDLMVCETPCLAQMVEAYGETGGNLAAVIEVPREQTRRYGVLDVVSDDGRLVRARGVVEKPEPIVAPSTSTIIGRYIIQPEVFKHLDSGKTGSGGEVQLTDALARLIDDGQAFHGLRFAGKRFDCGDKLGFLEATIALGLQHPELGLKLREVLTSYLFFERETPMLTLAQAGGRRVATAMMETDLVGSWLPVVQPLRLQRSQILARRQAFYGAAIYALGDTALGFGAAQGPRDRVEKCPIRDAYVERMACDYDGPHPLTVAWEPGNGATSEVFSQSAELREFLGQVGDDFVALPEDEFELIRFLEANRLTEEARRQP